MNRFEWAGRFLAETGLPDTPQNRTAIVAWATAEGAHARCNPLCTTLGRSGATNYNSAGVKNYPSLEVGLEATKSTLAVDDYGYPEIRAALRHGDDPISVARAIETSKWGTHHVETVVRHMQSDAQYAQQSAAMPVEGTPPAVEPHGQPPAPTPGGTEPMPPEHNFHDNPEYAGPDGEIVACVSAPAGGGWVVFRDGSVFTVEPAPFYGSYPGLPENDRKADPLFKGAVAGPDGGLILIHDTWTGGQAGLYHFGPQGEAGMAVAAAAHELPDGVTVNP